MKRIFATLAVVSTLLLLTALVLGLNIGDPANRAEAVQRVLKYHFLTAMAALVFAALVHAIVLTYFMGTGRWIEETVRVYHLDEQWLKDNQSLKYRTLVLMGLALLMLILTGAVGAAVDPASAVDFRSVAGIPGDTIHFLVASTMIGVNLVVNLWEFQAIRRNSDLITGVLNEVQRMRVERGLPV